MPGRYVSPYEGSSHGRYVSPYERSSSRVKAPKKKHSGFLGHLVKQTGKDFYDVATKTPGGIYTAAKTIVNPSVQAAKHGPNSRQVKKAERAQVGLGKSIAASTYQDLRHPLRHPGFTALDVLGIASAGTGTALRVGAAGKAVRAAEGADKFSAGVKAAARRPLPEPRPITFEGKTVKIPAATSPIIRVAQKKVLDPLRTSFIGANVPFIGAAHVVGKENARAIRYGAAVAGSPIGEFTAEAKAAGMLDRVKVPRKGRGRVAGLTADALAKQHALRVVAEGVSPDERIRFHQTRLAKGYEGTKRKNPDIARMRKNDFTQGHRQQIKLNEDVKKYVTVQGGKLSLTPELQKTYDAMLRVTGNREAVLEGLNKLNPEVAEARLHKPGRVLKGAKSVPVIETIDPERIRPGMSVRPADRKNVGQVVSVDNETQTASVHFYNRATGLQETKTFPLSDLGRQVGTKLEGQEGFRGGQARIPTVPAYKKPRIGKPTPGQAGAINVVQTPGSLTHPYTGAAYKAGKIRNDVQRLVAESGIEAQRHYTLLKSVDELKSIAKDAPTSKHDVPIRIEELPGQPTIHEILSRLDEQHASPEKIAELSHTYEAIRQRLFPSPADVPNIPAVKYVDERLLGGLNKKNPLIGWNDHASLRGVMKVNDAINNASKLALLYLKPAYVAPNLLGNLAMNLVQQGVFAPSNLIRAARMNAKYDKQVIAKVDASMGEGYTGSLASEQGLAAKATQGAANFYNKLVDLIPRRASFLHEARRQGYGDRLEKLFDSENADDLEQVTRRANQEIIDYGNLNPIEQSIVRRVIFFYPWVKGASVWSVHFVTEHPIQAAAATQIAKEGQRRQQAALGDQVPLWASALIPTGNGRTVNPAGISVLQTPADIGAQVAGMIPGGGAPNPQPLEQLSPALQIALNTLSGNQTANGRLLRGVPAVRAVGQGSPSKTFPSQNEGVTPFLLWLLGSGFVPRETSVPALQKAYQNQFKR